MSFSYNPARTDPVSRLRFALGDTMSPGLASDEEYQASLALCGSEAAAVRVQAAGLAARFATEPSRVSLPSGLSVSWDERIAQWNRIATGTAGAGAGPPGPGRGAQIGSLVAGGDYRPR